jgi:hypothetical protein
MTQAAFALTFFLAVAIVLESEMDQSEVRPGST